ncbi:MAG TPA: hypothetical protein VLE21_01565 [Candidatus Nitrosocosmicus sp.]|nr:hypothetical protein [Candidatus Nitrosocosmicus sp.]
MKTTLHMRYQSFVIRSMVLITLAVVVAVAVEIIVERYVGRGKSKA